LLLARVRRACGERLHRDHGAGLVWSGVALDQPMGDRRVEQRISLAGLVLVFINKATY